MTGSSSEKENISKYHMELIVIKVVHPKDNLLGVEPVWSPLPICALPVNDIMWYISYMEFSVVVACGG